MDHEHVFDQDLHHRQTADERQLPRTVVVELSCNGTARIREAPPDVLVMVVQSFQVVHGDDSKSVAAGGRGELLASNANCAQDRATPHRINVEFPG